METLNEVQKLAAEFAEKKEELAKELKVSFKDLFIPFLEKWKDIVYQIGWVQYTPYFNDGDPCVFSVNEIVAAFAPTEVQKAEEDFDLDEYLEEIEWPWEGDLPIATDCKWDNKTAEERIVENEKGYYTEPVARFDSVEQACECNREFLNIVKSVEAIPDDVLQDVLGEHVQVTITLDGIECDEYDHE